MSYHIIVFVIDYNKGAHILCLVFLGSTIQNDCSTEQVPSCAMEADVSANQEDPPTKSLCTLSQCYEHGRDAHHTDDNAESEQHTDPFVDCLPEFEEETLYDNLSFNDDSFFDDDNS